MCLFGTRFLFAISQWGAMLQGLSYLRTKPYAILKAAETHKSAKLWKGVGFMITMMVRFFIWMLVFPIKILFSLFRGILWIPLILLGFILDGGGPGPR